MSEPIRILQIVTSMEKGGIENMLMNFYRKTDREKVQFDFLVHAPEKAEFEDEIESLGGRVYRLPVQRSVKHFIGYLNALEEFFKGHREYKIIHCHMNALSLFPIFAAKKAGVPVRVAHSHVALQNNSYTSVFRRICKRLLSVYCTDRFACGEKAGRYMFGDQYFDKGLVAVVNNGIDCERFRFNQEKRLEIRKKYGFGDEVVIGHVGRFDEFKNQSFLIDILDCLKKADVKVKLLLLGEGSLFDEIKAKVRKLGLSDSVVFAGVVPDVYNYLNAMDVFVFPSVFEGLPLTLVEAQANGLTILASDAVSSESDLTGLIEFLPLSSGAEAWAEKLKSEMPLKRQDKTDRIREAGYDSETSAKWLENFYLEKSKEI
ncbi:MAG: glycosyltransferase family 1 protein [Oscillospiraceae bacterium]|nr:glycosyltransferase family 1 protein [Oscillospiraceae bacterium]